MLNIQPTNTLDLNILLRRLYCLGNSENEYQCDILLILGNEETHSIKVFADRCLRKHFSKKVIFVNVNIQTFSYDTTFWNWYFKGKLHNRLTHKKYSTVVCYDFKTIINLLQLLNLLK